MILLVVPGFQTGYERSKVALELGISAMGNLGREAHVGVAPEMHKKAPMCWVVPSHELTWVCAQTPAERLVSSWKGPFCTPVFVGGRPFVDAAGFSASFAAYIQRPAHAAGEAGAATAGTGAGVSPSGGGGGGGGIGCVARLGEQMWPWLSKPMVPSWGRCTTHFRTYFSGDWGVHWGYGILTHSHVGMG